MFTATGHRVMQTVSKVQGCCPQVSEDGRAGQDDCSFKGLTSAWAHGAAGGRPETKAGEKNGLPEGTAPAWNT